MKSHKQKIMNLPRENSSIHGVCTEPAVTALPWTLLPSRAYIFTVGLLALITKKRFIGVTGFFTMVIIIRVTVRKNAQVSTEVSSLFFCATYNSAQAAFVLCTETKKSTENTHNSCPHHWVTLFHKITRVLDGHHWPSGVFYPSWAFFSAYFWDVEFPSHLGVLWTLLRTHIQVALRVYTSRSLLVLLFLEHGGA